MSTMPSIEDRGAWHCPSCPGAAMLTVGGGLSCIMCGADAQVRPAWFAAQRHAARADVITPPAAPVRGAPPSRNACFNRPDKTGEYLAQDGYCEPMQDGFGVWFKGAKYVSVPHVFSEDCRYDRNGSDPKCAGCSHSKGADYADPY